LNLSPDSAGQQGEVPVFENIIGQAAAGQLKADILSQRLAPSMLFFGPAASGKGSTAMELARSLSCEKGQAQWNCACPSCARHRSLIHADLAMIGPRSFTAEIAASRAAFLRDTASAAGRSLFIRSLRKLLARFAPSVWEYEPKSNKLNPLPLLHSLEEELDEFETVTVDLSSADTLGDDKHDRNDPLNKLTDSLVRNAVKLDECISEAVPIAQVRKAAYWARLSPAGKRKTLIIENADRMEEKARSALLKLLEEPPESISIILTALRREAVMPTILSRLRPYRFTARGSVEEKEILRRVFRDPRWTQEAAPSGEAAPSKEGAPSKETGSTNAAGLIGAYLESFLPQPSDKLLPLAAFFVAAVARSAVVYQKSRGIAEIPDAVAALGSYCARIAESAGLERPVDVKETISALLSQSSDFEGRSFPRFLSLVLDLVSWSLEQFASNPNIVACRETWRLRIREAYTAYSVWNQRPEAALESLFFRLREEAAGAALA
jgi:DNA polymerase-3 subunit gamma/tau